MSPLTELIGSAKAYGWGSFAAAEPAFESIATVSLSSAASNITFSSIPATYKHLQIRGLARSSNIYYNAGILLRLNGDSGSNYSRHRFEGYGETALGQDGTASATNTQLTASTGGASLSNNFGVFVLEILDYYNTNKNTTMRCLTGYDNNGNGSGNDRGVIQINSSVWDNTSAVNSIVFTLNDSSNFVSGSKFALYGIKGV